MQGPIFYGDTLARTPLIGCTEQCNDQVYMYMCVPHAYTYTHTYVHTSIHTYVRTYMHACVYMLIQAMTVALHVGFIETLTFALGGF